MARPSFHGRIRELLAGRPEGMTTAEIAKALEERTSSVYNSLRVMPDAYIAEWKARPGVTKKLAYWRVAQVPQHAERS